MVLGIPTRSDVEEKYYKTTLEEMLLLEELNNNLSSVFSSIPLHNHVTRAVRSSTNRFIYNHAGFIILYKIITAYQKKGSLNKNVLKNLDEEALFNFYFSGIEKTKESLEKASALVDKHVKEQWSEYDAKTGNLVKRPPIVDGNLKELLLKYLNDIESKFKELYQIKRLEPNESLHNMWLILKSFNSWFCKEETKDEVWENLAGFGGIVSQEINQRMFKLYELEKEDKSINSLVEENNSIAKRSDLCIRFDEIYVTGYKGWSIPAKPCLIKQEFYKSDFIGLSERTTIRDIIKEVLSNKPSVVINGIKHIPHDNRFVSCGKSYQEISNLLAKPICNIHDFSVLNPETWAVEEAKLISLFREGKIKPEIFLGKYKDNDTLGRTYKERLENVKYYTKNVLKEAV